MDPTTAVKKFFEEALSNGARPCLNDFVATHVDFIAKNSSLEENIEDKWTNLFYSIAINDNVQVRKQRTKPDFKSVVQQMHQPAASSSSSPLQTDSKGTKRARSMSSKSDSYPMTERMISDYEAAFKAMDEAKKWKLPDGKFVEDILHEFGKTCSHEHLAHSFVLNMDDPRIRQLFSDEQYQTIMNAGRPTLPSLKDAIKAIFNDCSDVIKAVWEKVKPGLPIDAEQEKEIVDRLWQKLTSYGFFDPTKQFDEDWLQRALLDILNWYRFDTLSLLTDEPSEMDFIVRVWSILDKCFDNIHVKTQRDHTCIATNVRQNQDRGVTGVACIEGKQLSTRPDLIFCWNGVELGAGEVGKEDLAGLGKKELIETQLHCPKILKDMMNVAGAKCNNNVSLLRNLRVLSYNQTWFRMSASVLDCPGGYVCRVRTTESYEVSRSPSLMQGGILPILKLTLMSKELVRESTAEITRHLLKQGDEDPGFKCRREDDENSSTVSLPTAMRSSEKRQKSNS